MSVLNSQVGGQHYTNMRCQPQYFCVVNNLNGCVQNFLKYILRNKEDRLMDLGKAMSCISFAKGLEHHMAGKLHCPFISLDVFLELNEVTGESKTAINCFFSRDWENAEKAVMSLVEAELDRKEQEQLEEEMASYVVKYA